MTDIDPTAAIERDPSVDYSEQSWNVSATGAQTLRDFAAAQALLRMCDGLEEQEPTP